MKIPGTRLAVLAVLACGSRQLPGKGGDGDSQDGVETDGDGIPSDRREPAELARVLAVDWAFEEIRDPDGVAPPRTRVSIATTDETGATAVRPMGEFAGVCAEKPGGPGSLGQALLAASCPLDGGGGTELRLRRHRGHLILLRARYGETDDLSFEEAGRMSVAPGVDVRARQ